MNRFIELLKINIKLLLRNKGFLFFLCVTPIVSAMVLNLKTENAVYGNKEEKNIVIELSEPGKRALYVGDNTKFIVKVYDGSKTELSEYLLERLAATGMFSVCRCDVQDMTDKQVKEQAQKDAFDDRAGVLFHIKEDFENKVMQKDYIEAFQVFLVSDDERIKLFEKELKNALLQINYVAENVDNNPEKVTALLKSIEEKMPEKKVVQLKGKEELVLTDEQINQKSLIGYAYAIITLGFLFCGVCIAHTVIEEQNNKVYMRAMLSKLGRGEYFVSKFVMAFLISIMQTFVLGICIFTVKGMDFGISKFIFLLLIFCLGLVFCMISLLLGILLGDVMSANYAVFAVWSISALLSGLYFSLDQTSAVIKAVSYLMPQRWFLKAAGLILAGEKGAFSMVVCVTLAYLIVCISVGSIGLKMKRSEA